MALDLDQPAASPGGHAQPWWTVITLLLVAAIFMQAVFAGAMLSGVAWAAQAHRLNGMVLIGSTGMAALLALLFRSKLAWTLLALAVAAFAQAVIGVMAAKGANLMWLHVPLGVALVGLATQAVRQSGSGVRS